MPEKKPKRDFAKKKVTRMRLVVVTLPEEKTKKRLCQKKVTYMRLVVVTEYCKSMRSQSGRHSHSDSVVLLIRFKNSCALLALKKGVE